MTEFTPSFEAPGARYIELLINDFARSIELRQLSEEELGPLFRSLHDALVQWNENPMNPALADAVRAAREHCAQGMRRWEAPLREWVPIRDTASRLEELSDFLTDAQWEEVGRLLAIEASDGIRDSAFDDDRRHSLRLLDQFDASMPA